MKQILYCLLMLFLSSSAFSQSQGMSDQDILTSISNLPTPFVDMVSSKISTLSTDAKDALILLSDERKEVNNAIKSKAFHDNFHNWMESFFTEEEMNDTMAEMATSIKKSSN